MYVFRICLTLLLNQWKCAGLNKQCLKANIVQQAAPNGMTKNKGLIITILSTYIAFIRNTANLYSIDMSIPNLESKDTSFHFPNVFTAPNYVSQIIGKRYSIPMNIYTFLNFSWHMFSMRWDPTLTEKPRCFLLFVYSYTTRYSTSSIIFQTKPKQFVRFSAMVLRFIRISIYYCSKRKKSDVSQDYWSYITDYRTNCLGKLKFRLQTLQTINISAVIMGNSIRLPRDQSHNPIDFETAFFNSSSICSCYIYDIRVREKSRHTINIQYVRVPVEIDFPTKVQKCMRFHANHASRISRGFCNYVFCCCSHPKAKCF